MKPQWSDIMGQRYKYPFSLLYLHTPSWGVKFAACTWWVQLFGRITYCITAPFCAWGAEGFVHFSNSGVASLVHQTIAKDATFLELALMFARTLSCKSCVHGYNHAVLLSMSEQHCQTEPHLNSLRLGPRESRFSI